MRFPEEEMRHQSIQLTIALREEIGDPNLFIGRQKDLDFFLDWVDLVGREIARSQAKGG